MCHKVISFISIIVLSGFCITLFGMNQDLTLEQLVKKNTFPVLALNNYIIPVASAYDALKKEAFLSYIVLQKNKERMRTYIVGTNVRKNLDHKKEGLVKRIDVSDIRKNMMFFARDFCYRTVYIKYYFPSHRSKRLDAYMSIDTFKYWFDSTFHTKHVHLQQYTIKNISEKTKRKIGILLRKGMPQYFELYSAGNLSEWIMVESDYQPIIRNEIPFLNDETSEENEPIYTNRILPIIYNNPLLSTTNSTHLDIVEVKDDKEKNICCSFDNGCSLF